MGFIGVYITRTCFRDVLICALLFTKKLNCFIMTSFVGDLFLKSNNCKIVRDETSFFDSVILIDSALGHCNSNRSLILHRISSSGRYTENILFGGNTRNYEKMQCLCWLCTGGSLVLQYLTKKSMKKINLIGNFKVILFQTALSHIV